MDYTIKLRSMRKLKCMSQSQLSIKSGLAVEQISRIENSKLYRLTVQEVISLMEALNCNFYDLVHMENKALQLYAADSLGKNEVELLLSKKDVVISELKAALREKDRLLAKYKVDIQSVKNTIAVKKPRDKQDASYKHLVYNVDERPLWEQLTIYPSEYVARFYGLFRMHDGDCFVGSKNHMRVILQLQLKRYIPQKYIDDTLRHFIKFGLVVKTDERIPLSPVIGDKVYENSHFSKYRRADLPDTAHRLQNLEVVFADINKYLYDISTMEQVQEIRSLEKYLDTEMKTVIRDKKLLSGKGSHNVDLTDTGLLYDFSWQELEQVICDLESIRQKKHRGINV